MRDAVRDPERRGVADGGFRAREVQVGLVAGREEDVPHRGDRRAHEQTQPLSLGPQERVNRHVIRDLVRARPERQREHERGEHQRCDGREPSVRRSFAIARSVYWRQFCAKDRAEQATWVDCLGRRDAH